MDGQKNFCCITEGEKARKKAMKIAVGLPGNKATFSKFTTLQTPLLNLVIIVVLVLKNCFPFNLLVYVTFSGVESSALKGQNRDQIEVKGDNIDIVKLATLLRKKVGHASIVSVAEDKKEEKKEEKKKDEPKIQCPYGPPYAFYEIRDPCYDTNVCSIL